MSKLFTIEEIIEIVDSCSSTQCAALLQLNIIAAIRKAEKGK